jgi:hypothetical protein
MRVGGYVGHAACMEGMGYARITSVRKSERIIPLGEFGHK